MYPDGNIPEPVYRKRVKCALEKTSENRLQTQGPIYSAGVGQNLPIAKHQFSQRQKYIKIIVYLNLKAVNIVEENSS